MTAKVASIHFAPVAADRSIYGGMYSMRAVALGADPEILQLEDMVQKDEGPVSMGSGGKRVQLRYHVDAYEIASDIVSHWTQNGLGMNPDAHPGIWVVRERVAVLRKDAQGKDQVALDGFDKQIFRPATQEETQAMWAEDLSLARAADRKYAEWCYIDGNRIASDARQIQFIPENYKRAARQYGLQADWLREGAALEVMPCPSCTKVISKRAIVCPLCQGVVDLQRFAHREAEKQAAIAAAIKAAGLQAAQEPAVALKTQGPKPLLGLRHNPPPVAPEGEPALAGA